MVGWVGGWVGRSNPHRGDVPFFASPESLDRSEERGFIPASLLPFYRQSHDIHGFRGSAKSEKEKKTQVFKKTLLGRVRATPSCEGFPLGAALALLSIAMRRFC